MNAPVQLVIVIGQSGSGHSTALNILEDAGLTAVDNLPLALMDQLVALSVETENKKLAIGVDLRTAGLDPETIIRMVTNLKSAMQDGCQVVLIKPHQKNFCGAIKQLAVAIRFQNRQTA